ncbi:MAG: DUF2797 domain-containing protein [Pseudomonadota bacterium]|nr:DUF2797 domain-containing protein [Pseudomonadota bacterium]MED5441637.1 DUF2797 domain-containing protein [Pseudomonadota bacterium]
MSKSEFSGHLDKMRIHPAAKVAYSLVLNNEEYPINDFLGKSLSLLWEGDIHCRACNRPTNKSFSQGYCYPCFTKLPECDSCIMSPEKCHFHLGTCRDAAWGERVCFNDHIVYLANSSGIKVGITRMKNMPSRWLDQGAAQALPIARVATRRLAGLVEDIIRRDIADKTNWRAMLKGDSPELDLVAERDRLKEHFAEELNQLELEQGPGSITWLTNESVRHFNYPVIEYPTKVSSHNFDKTAEVSGRLMGMKGQYLILDTGVINLRKFTSYNVRVTVNRES